MWLKQWLVKEKIDRVGFAKTLGVAPATLSRYCSGKQKPHAKMVVKIHNQTRGQVSFADFYGHLLDPPIGTLEFTNTERE